MHNNQYSGNPRKILCNVCYRTLTTKEVNAYDYLWQHSGDMYCMKHRVCLDDCRRTPCRLKEEKKNNES